MEVDVCIISYAKNDLLHRVTCNGIESLLKSETDVKFNVFVVESNKDINYVYPNTKTIYPDFEFNYNAYLNLAVSQGSAPYVVLANNDLIYEKGFATEIINSMQRNPDIKSASPFCPQVHNAGFRPFGIMYGYGVREKLCGWCIFQKRDIYDTIKELDTSVKFWYSDNLYADQLIANNIPHALITNSVVNHHENNLGVSGNYILTEKEKAEMMDGQRNAYIIAREKYMQKIKQNYESDRNN